ncbi:type II toxin-antitoxin system RelE/ParE family toxin [Hoeflea sp. G2-23]|uniref:Type II toxin-antitoxin system RelE/ParE family toxin n=1 Tax=Hoeflea algicola TaxID=2983763 RepID=A0ABT3Z3H8_9HYPH|nr:type II toxin-antitoxin system RelE/ParE family toxin [Hoeflea algicola]MCY0146325.1 type II toxin-antitoxin system RelE/ParE family toxin [Hoeflea algicola]
MAEARLSPRAEQDIRDIWRNIAVDNEPAADALLRRMLEKADLAATQPDMGAARPELSPTARTLIEGNYILIYEPMAYGSLVVAIVHGGRNPQNWL